MSIRAGVELAVIRALAPLVIGNGGYLRTLRVYAGDLQPAREEEDFQRVTQGALPAVLVTTGDGDYQATTMAYGRKSDLVFNVELLVGSSNLRNQEARFGGDTGLSTDPGIYQILEDIRDRLFHRPLEAKGVNIARPVSEAPVLRSNDRSIWLATYTVRTDAIEDPLDINDPDYTLIVNGFNFPVGDPGDPANPVIESEFEPGVIP